MARRTLVRGSKTAKYESKDLKLVKSWLKQAFNTEDETGIEVKLGDGQLTNNNAFLAITRKLTIGIVKFDVYTYLDRVYEVYAHDVIRLRFIGSTDDLGWHQSKASIVPTLEWDIDGLELNPGQVIRMHCMVRFNRPTSGGETTSCATAMKVYSYKDGNPKVRYSVDNLSWLGRSAIDFNAMLERENAEVIKDWAVREPDTK